MAVPVLTVLTLFQFGAHVENTRAGIPWSVVLAHLSVLAILDMVRGLRLIRSRAGAAEGLASVMLVAFLLAGSASAWVSAGRSPTQG